MRNRLEIEQYPRLRGTRQFRAWEPTLLLDLNPAAPRAPQLMLQTGVCLQYH